MADVQILRSEFEDEAPTCWPPLSPNDAVKFLICNTHIGTPNVDFQNKQYVYTRSDDGSQLVNLGYTWYKLGLAARAIAAVEDPADICVVSSRPFVQRALIKFAAHTGATPIFGRFVPGSFTNQIQKKNFKEPRLIIVSDPRADHQAVAEASYVNIPVIAFTNVDSPLKHVDIAIPGNNKGPESIGLMWWMLAREVLKLKMELIVEDAYFVLGEQTIMPDLYFYRDPEEQKKEEEEAKQQAKEAEAAAAPEFPQPHDDEQEREVEFKHEEIGDWAVLEPEPVQQQNNPSAAQQGAEDGDEW